MNELDQNYDYISALVKKIKKIKEYFSSLLSKLEKNQILTPTDVFCPVSLKFDKVSLKKFLISNQCFSLYPLSSLN